MNDKHLFKLCLMYLQRGNQPITRGDLIKMLQARLVQENKHVTENNRRASSVDTGDGGSGSNDSSIQPSKTDHVES